MQKLEIIEKDKMRIVINRSESHIIIMEVDSKNQRMFGTDIDISGGIRYGENAKWKISWGSGGERNSLIENHITLLELAIKIRDEENKKINK